MRYRILLGLHPAGVGGVKAQGVDNCAFGERSYMSEIPNVQWNTFAIGVEGVWVLIGEIRGSISGGSSCAISG